MSNIDRYGKRWKVHSHILLCKLCLRIIISRTICNIITVSHVDKSIKYILLKLNLTWNQCNGQFNETSKIIDSLGEQHTAQKARSLLWSINPGHEITKIIFAKIVLKTKLGLTMLSVGWWWQAILSHPTLNSISIWSIFRAVNNFDKTFLWWHQLKYDKHFYRTLSLRFKYSVSWNELSGCIKIIRLE